MYVDYRLIRSDRRSIAIEITACGETVVRAPRYMAQKDIDRFVESRRSWIESHRKPHLDLIPFSLEDCESMKKWAKAELTPRVWRWAEKLGVEIFRVSFRLQRTRWGSCSAEGAISLNALLVMMPEEIADYIIVHELCHLREMNHSPRFWALVRGAFPTSDQALRWLKEHEREWIGRLPR